MNENIKDIIINTIVSGMIGVTIGLSSILISSNWNGLIFTLIYSAMCGVFIGTLCRLLIIHFYDRKKIGILKTLLIVAISIGIITTVGFYSQEQGFVISREWGFGVAIAELLGIGFSFFSIQESIKLNKKLNIKKIELIANRKK